MPELIAFIAGLCIGGLVGVSLKHDERAQFVEPNTSQFTIDGLQDQADLQGAEFIEPITPVEKFQRANNITDLTDDE